jgi:flagellar secretion chaperone FliS
MYTPVSQRAASAYKRVGIETSVESASSHQLVRLLYEALLHSLASARQALAKNDIATKGTEIGKAVRILQEGLIDGLNLSEGGEVSDNLHRLYGYCVRTLTHANLKNDAAKITEVIDLIAPIADAWKQIANDPAVANRTFGA